MKGSYVDITANDGGKFRAYLALPENGTGPGLVLLQEIFGINANMRAAADHFAEEGYVAVVPDLFWRMEPGVELPYESIEKARALGTRLDLHWAINDILATAKGLALIPNILTGKVGVLGFCLGGLLAYLTATRSKDEIACAVSYYGVRIDQFLEEAHAVKCPLMFHFGGQDSLTNKYVAKVQESFKQKNYVDVFEYTEAGHGFSSPLRPDHYNEVLAKLAHQRSLGLLRSTIGPKQDLLSLWEKFSNQFFFHCQPAEVIHLIAADCCIHFVPTMAGVIGKKAIENFCQNFLPGNIPDDFKMKLQSCNITSNTVINEIEVSFTHNKSVDWLAPNVQPTGSKIKMVWFVTTKFRGTKISRMHVHWDQAAVLIQLGLLKDTN